RLVEISANMRHYACYLCECPLLDVWLPLPFRGVDHLRGSIEHKSEKHRTSRRTRRSWIALDVATGELLLLRVCWPLMNAVTPSTEAIAADHDITVGSDEDYSASLSLPQSGWKVDTTATQVGQNHLFLRGPVQLELTSVTAPSTEPATPEELWKGLERTSRIGDPSAELGPPKPITTTAGDEGLIGELRPGNRVEHTAVYPSPDGMFAVELVLGGKEATAADLDAVKNVLRSLTFEHEEGNP